MTFNLSKLPPEALDELYSLPAPIVAPSNRPYSNNNALKLAFVQNAYTICDDAVGKTDDPALVDRMIFEKVTKPFCKKRGLRLEDVPPKLLGSCYLDERLPEPIQETVDAEFEVLPKDEITVPTQLLPSKPVKLLGMNGQA